MRIIAMNGSPRREKGNTDRILKPFLAGAEAAGAEIDLVYLQGKKISPCLGCFQCRFKRPFKCVQEDDMAGLLERFQAADLAVMSTPLYANGMTAQMKTFFDRTIPLADPYIEIKDGHCAYPNRGGLLSSGLVLISSCGFHELDNFDPLVAHFKTICRFSGWKFHGALLRPHGDFLPVAEKRMKDKADEVYQAARRAGASLVENDVIPEDLLEKVAQDLVPLEAYLESANEYKKDEIKKAKAQKA
ncbi:flavodoxin family protein [Elusimicrobiota bacterium]